MERFWPVIHHLPSASERALQPRPNGLGLDDLDSTEPTKASSGLPEAEFNAALRAEGWRAFLFSHATAPQMLHEITDALYGVSEVLSSKALSKADPGAEPEHFLLTFEDAVEGVRRVLLLIDPRRQSVARASPSQVQRITASLLQDNGLQHMLKERIELTDAAKDAGHAAPKPISMVDSEHITAQELMAESSVRTMDGSGRLFIPVRFGREPYELMREMPPWFQAMSIAQSVGVRLLAEWLGAKSLFSETHLGNWHTFVIDGRCGERVSAPIVLIHGMFTTSASMLPLGVVMATKLRRLVLIPGMLDFDFGFSTSRPEAWSRLHAQSQLNGEPRVLPTPLSPLTWSDHIIAVVEYLERAVPKIVLELDGNAPTYNGLDVVGHSFGGWLATKIAARRPELIHKVVLLAPGGLGRYRIVSSAAPLGGLRTSIALLRQKMGPLTARLAASVFNTIARAPFTVHMLTSLHYHDYFSPGEVVPHEAMLLWGRADDLHRVWSTVSSNHSEDMEQRMLGDLPRGKGYWLEGASHALVIDSFPTVTELCASFLGSGLGGNEATNDTRTRLHSAADAFYYLGCKMGGLRPYTPMVRGDSADDDRTLKAKL